MSQFALHLPRRRDLLILGILFAIGIGYIASFLHFVQHSRNFLMKFPEFGDTINFVGANACRPCLSRDWYPPEGNWAWAKRDGAEIIVPRPQSAQGRRVLVLDAGGFLSPAVPARTIAVEVNGRPLGEDRLDDKRNQAFFDGAPYRHEFPLPPDIPDTDGTWTVKVKTDPPDRPSNYGSADWRELGVALRSLSFE